jgi:4-carboxymuconolactone decarboxylase
VRIGTKRVVSVTEPADAGVAKLSELIGPGPARAFRDECDPYERRLREAVVDFGYGQVWNSDRLEPRARMLLTVGVLAATGRTAELRTHLTVALDAGLSPDELAETFLHISLYAGFPAALDGTRELRRLLERRRGGSLAGDSGVNAQQGAERLSGDGEA